MRVARVVADRRRFRVLAFLTGSLGLALVTSGCLLSPLGYSHAPRLARWAIDDYVELEPDQRRQLDQALEAIHLWHRRHELPAYAAAALEAARRIERRLSPGDLDWADSVARARYAVLTGQLATQLAPLAATIAPVQIAKMGREFDRGNERFRAEFLEITQQERNRRRVEEGIELIEDWVGHLDRDQRRQLSPWLAALPDLSRHSLAQRLARQRAIRALFETRPPRDRLVAGLRLWLIGWEAGRTPEHERLDAIWTRQSRQLVLDLDVLLTAEQRRHAVAKLREHAEDFTSWSRKGIAR